MTKPNTFQELTNAVKNNEIKSAKDKSGNEWRFFYHEATKTLCYFKKRSSRKGLPFWDYQFPDLVSFKAESVRTEQTSETKVYNTLAKYKRLAEKATFTNSYIEKCKSLPSSRSEWVEQGKKGSYNSGITTGNKIDGVVISIDRIGKLYPHIAKKLRNAIENKTEGQICSRYPFAGYEMTISTRLENETEFFAHMSLEYKDCLNGYYYILINDNNFIGYDVD